MSLNPEPSRPEDRAEQHLPPKSYADAAEEAITGNGGPQVDGEVNGHGIGAGVVTGEAMDSCNVNDENDPPSRPKPVQRRSTENWPFPKNQDPDPMPQDFPSAGLSNLQFNVPMPDDGVDLVSKMGLNREAPQSEGHGEAKSYAEAVKEHGEPEPYVEATEEGANDNTHQNGDATPEQFVGAGMDETPRTPIRGLHKKSSSRHVNGVKKEKSEDTPSKVIYEKHQSPDGEHLVSVETTREYEIALAAGKRERSRQREERRESELVSGRRAGAGWERSGIRWAPLSIPLQRRLQTLVVLMHTLSIAALLTMFFFLCAIPLLWPLLLPYLLYVLFSSAHTSGELSHRSDRLRRSPIWSLFASYFPARLHRSQPLPPTRKYIFGYHPHGIISHGAFAAFATEALGFSTLFPGITNTLLTLDSNFRIPLYREYALRMGLASVSRESCENLLSKGGRNGEGMGRAITIVVGGARESLDARPHSLRLVLRRRKGFVKLAVRTGADLVPVLAFGENEIYEQLDAAAHPHVLRAQLAVKRLLGFTVPLFHARGVFNYDVGLMPYRRPLNVVVGRPVEVVQSRSPADAYVDEVHAKYVAELERVWDEWKDTFARGRRAELEIVE
ncbi:hypothetical protein B0A49_12506 [Cryomyces minteri]|uniref:diacylglycerol O-acyltransferase n=2 Tax=Cryomyces minteri TaxID=331657 RepID=A0A4U0VGX1_9PEZI|nr:hypothetical protein B0A49_12506 [Cryomyces minteri]